jgi:hypothetical protein
VEMTMDKPAFDAAAKTAFSSIYPETPAVMAHNLADHPLFTLEALIALSRRMDPIDVEYNRADLPIGIAPEDVPQNGLSIADTIRSIEDNGSWMVMKFVEQDELYNRLLNEILAELEPIVGPKTGPMVKREAFIFISSPNSVTPYHFDPEHNILLQLHGTKTMTQFPAGDARFAAGVEHERFHAGGHRNLPWDDGFAAGGRAFDLVPGQCVYVPVKAPHWVQNGPQLSISFSITWRSEWSYAEENAHSINGILRKAGLEPAMPHRYPRQNSLKSNMYRAVRKLGLGS